MNTAVATTDVAVMHIKDTDSFVGFSGLTYKVESVVTTLSPMRVTVEFSHASKPGERASMTFSNPRQSMRIIKK